MEKNVKVILLQNSENILLDFIFKHKEVTVSSVSLRAHDGSERSYADLYKLSSKSESVPLARDL